MAPGASGSDQKGDLGRQPRRPQRERGLPVQQKAPAGDRSPGPLSDQMSGTVENRRLLAAEGKVFFGAWVEIENDEGDIKRFRIVGYDEIFGRKDYISIDSPMARALLKKEVGDLAIVNTPAGEASWYVNEIEYVK